MSNEQSPAQQSASPKTPSIAFKDMDFGQKLVFTGKVCVFLVSCGFAYPTIFAD